MALYHNDFYSREAGRGSLNGRRFLSVRQTHPRYAGRNA